MKPKPPNLKMFYRSKVSILTTEIETESFWPTIKMKLKNSSYKTIKVSV